MEKKIHIKENEKIEDVLEKIRQSNADYVILHIPENSELKSSLDNFHAIKRESIIKNTEIVVESLDSFILELAALAKVKAINPLFGEEEKVFSDIIPKHSTDSSEGEAVQHEKEDFQPEDTTEKEGEEEKNKYDFLKSAVRKNNKPPIKRKSSVVLRSRRFKIYLTAILLLLVFAGVAGHNILPRATVYLELKRTPVEVDNSVLVAVDLVDKDEISEDIFLAGQLISAGKNVEMRFNASESDFVERHSEGDIYVYNTFTTEPVSLVERTRFVSPEGKIYRTKERVTVPGATGEQGELNPSRVRVTLIADEPGENFNTGPRPNERWRIPGFQEAGLMDFYEGMYGEPTTGFSGGFIGETFFPNEEDIANALEETENAVFNALTIELELISSTDLAFLMDTREITILESFVERIADEDGKFGVFIDAEMKVFAVKKGALELAAIDIMLPESDIITGELSTGFEVVDSSIFYKDVIADWEVGEVRFQAEGSVIVKPSIKEDVLGEMLTGKRESEINAVILTVPHLSKSNVSLWPRWVRKIPDDENRLKIVID